MFSFKSKSKRKSRNSAAVTDGASMSDSELEAREDAKWDQFAVLHTATKHQKTIDDIADDRPRRGCLNSLGLGLGQGMSTSSDRSTVGYCSEDSRLDWCHANDLGFVERMRLPKTLIADKNPEAPLYIWQVYSLIGREMIRDLLSDFYDCVFGDTEEIWFRMGFINGDKKHHTSLQERYWIDALGGGAQYPGGEKRINFHHEVNAGQEMMSSDGAERWMHHMTTALIERGHADLMNKVDKRIFPCIIDFLETKMIKYAERFQWEFDYEPFDELRQHIEK